MKSCLALTAITIMALAYVTVAGDGFPNCYPQGPGSCTAIYACSSEIASDQIDCSGGLYDFECNGISGDGHNNPSVGDAWYSELPYTLDITVANGIYGPTQFQFMYAGGTYGTGTDSSWRPEDCSYVLEACTGIVAAFPW